MNREEYRRMFEAEESHWWYAGMRAITEILLAEAPVGARPLWLDAGCGTGKNLAEMEGRCRAIGVDRSAEALGFCRQRRVSAIQARIDQLPFSDATFDGAICFDVLSHVDVADEAAAVRELGRVLRPGGWLLIRVPALPILRRAHDEAVHTRHRYHRAELSSLLEKSGLEVRRASYGNMLTLPFLAVRVALDRALGASGSDVAPAPRGIDTLFRACLAIEARLIRHLDLPIGSSVMALAQKPRGVSG
jgi:SAM-dependent methyltransferase